MNKKKSWLSYALFVLSLIFIAIALSGEGDSFQDMDFIQIIAIVAGGSLGLYLSKRKNNKKV